MNYLFPLIKPAITKASNPRQPDLDLHYPAERWQQINPLLKNRFSLSTDRFHISADLLYGPDANTPSNHLVIQLSGITRSADYASSSSLAFRIPR